MNKSTFYKILIYLSLLICISPLFSSLAFAEAIHDYDWYLNMHQDKKVADDTIIINAADFKQVSENSSISIGSYKAKDNVLIWESDEGFVEYSVFVKEEGMYNISINYCPVSDDQQPIQKKLYIDGSLPFTQAGRIVFTRLFKSEYPFRKDEFDNELRPRQSQVYIWKNQYLTDSEGFHAKPFLFFMTKGEHTVRIEGIKGAIALSAIEFTQPHKLLSYSQYMDKYSQIPKYNGSLIIKEAEDIKSKSHSSIQTLATNQAGVYPVSNEKIVFNTLGGYGWRGPTESVSWEINAPSSGLYSLAIKYSQNYKPNETAFRKLEINGEVPFQEMENVPFQYGTVWRNCIPGDEKGNPYLFYLDKGTHTITMTVSSEIYADVIKKTKDAANIIMQTREMVKRATGIGMDDMIDKYRKWDIDESIPQLVPNLQKCETILLEIIEEMKDINKIDKNVFDVPVSSLELIRNFLKNTELIPNKPEEIGLLETRLFDWALTLSYQPILVDRIYLYGSSNKPPKAAPSFWQSLKYQAINFIKSFSKNYRTSKRDSKDSLDILVALNRDYVTLLQEMADEQFTPETGIKVNINFLPDPGLLVMYNAAGVAPDMAMGLGEGKPIEWAMRDSVVNLNTFDNYGKVKQRFAPGSLIPYHYDGGDYALPDTLTFNIMFFRKDILEKLDLELPVTWDDVKLMLPALQQKGYNFTYPRIDFLTLFYQNGLDIYSKNGLELEINSSKGVRVFKEWTEFYTVYGIPTEVQFYQHFRSGNIPIGLQNLNEYIKLVVSAPDIVGQWDIMPIPGCMDQDGNISRWHGGTTKGSMIFKSSNRQEDAWKFLDWWTSDSTQKEYSSNLESYFGFEFRWFSANINAFLNLTWTNRELNVMKEQLRWYKDIPSVPGGNYMTSRELNNAWNRVVLDNKNYREEFEAAVEAITREIYRKQMEFGLINKDGEVLRSLDIPVLKSPSLY